MTRSLDDIMLQFEAIHCPIKEKAKLYSWLFEYASQTIEFEKKDPLKATGYLKWLMVYKADKLYNACVRIYFKHKATNMEIEVPEKEIIPSIVYDEHQKGAKLPW